MTRKRKTPDRHRDSVSIRDAGQRSPEAVFTGFPVECFGFLDGLKRHNERSWFERHRAEFEQFVLEPSRTFVVRFGSALRARYPALVFDPAVNGTGSMFRLARDIRFSRDKSPYKTNLGFRFWLSEKARAKRHVGIYVNVATGGVEVYGGAHGLDPTKTRAFRNGLKTAKQGAQFQSIIDELLCQGYRLHGECLARAPREFPAEHPQANLARYKDLMAISPIIDRTAASQPALIDACVRSAAALKPLNDWFVKALGV